MKMLHQSTMTSAEIEDLLEACPVVVSCDYGTTRFAHANHRLIEDLKLVLILGGAEDIITNFNQRCSGRENFSLNLLLPEVHSERLSHSTFPSLHCGNKLQPAATVGLTHGQENHIAKGATSAQNLRIGVVLELSGSDFFKDVACCQSSKH